MRATALQPPPPTPITLIRAPGAGLLFDFVLQRVHIAVDDPHRCYLPASYLQNAVAAAPPALLLRLRSSAWPSTWPGPPRWSTRVSISSGQSIDAHRQAVARLAAEDALGHVAQARQARRRAPVSTTPPISACVHAHARQFPVHVLEQLLGARLQNLVDQAARHFARLAVLRAGAVPPRSCRRWRRPRRSRTPASPARRPRS